ncbi:MAG: redox-regulated ATPase YchF [Desulfovibrio sp.]|nr:redox-regulated ATPase YchF [Desulfovibrio sp.]
MKLGIVGLPNVGKSTLFNALTKAQNAQAANYPFCTIEPNTATVAVPDQRVDALAAKVSPQKTIYATVDFTDIAGLVRGASQGEGLGNQFLANIRECAAIIHVVRCFDDENIVHVEASVDPLRDIATIETELGLADLETISRRLEKTTKLAKANKDYRPLLEVWQALQAHLNEGQPASSFELPSDNELLSQAYKEMGLLTAKPVIFCANVQEDGMSEDNSYVKAVSSYAKAHGAVFCRICARLEEELQGLSPEDQAEMLASYGIHENGLAQIIRAGYTTLGLSSYFTAGPDDVRAWTIPKGCKAPKAAGVIHTDFERGFIRAEVISYDDYMSHKNEAECRACGVLRTEGKDYVVQDGDVMHFLFNV